MPVMACQTKGKPGWKWGESGRCYTYTKGDKASSAQAKKEARIQGAAIHARRGG